MGDRLEKREGMMGIYKSKLEGERNHNNQKKLELKKGCHRNMSI